MTTKEAEMAVSPVLTLRLDSHDRHAILFKLWDRVQHVHGPGAESDCVAHHAAELLLACECEEGGKLRTAVRVMAGRSKHSHLRCRVVGDRLKPVTVGGTSGTRLADGKWKGFNRVRKLPDGTRKYVPADARVEVGAMVVLALAGWPDYATGMYTGPVVTYPEGAPRLPVIPPDSAA